MYKNNDFFCKMQIINSNYPSSKKDTAKVGRIFRSIPHNSIGKTWQHVGKTRHIKSTAD